MSSKKQRKESKDKEEEVKTEKSRAWPKADSQMTK